MLKGLYTAYTGMINEQHRMDTLTNNLANSATVGFKRKEPLHRHSMMYWPIRSKTHRRCRIWGGKLAP